MSAPYSKALDLAKELVGHQTLSTHTLYMVASPIGNLADISIRALFVLQMVDFVACEDTRHTQSLCRSYGLEIPNHQWIALHQHNELEGAQKVTHALQSGAKVAYLSDAGTPGVSDPGSRLVSACIDQGLRVVPIPGPSSVTALLSASGAHDSDDQSFIFIGFLSSKATLRSQQIQSIALESRAQVILEAPHRILELAKALAVLDDRTLSVGRELTKQFERIQRIKARELLAWLEEDAHRQKGEFSILIHPLKASDAVEQEDFKVLGLLLEHLPLKTAVSLTTSITGQAKKVIYAEALRIKSKVQRDSSFEDEQDGH